MLQVRSHKSKSRLYSISTSYYETKFKTDVLFQKFKNLRINRICDTIFIHLAGVLPFILIKLFLIKAVCKTLGQTLLYNGLDHLPSSDPEVVRPKPPRQEGQKVPATSSLRPLVERLDV